jgi:hypothetical protein
MAYLIHPSETSAMAEQALDCVAQGACSLERKKSKLFNIS